MSKTWESGSQEKHLTTQLYVQKLCAAQRPRMIAEFPIVIIKHINGQKMIPDIIV